jgi:hypothetical protein
MTRDPEDECAFEFEILKAAISQELFDNHSGDTLPSQLIERIEQLRKLERKLLSGGSQRHQHVSAWIARCRPTKRDT